MKRLLSFVSIVELVAVVAAGCNFSISTANITQATLSKDVQGDKFEPVDPTTTFPVDQPVIHLVANVANAPSDTKVKSVWTAVDVGDVAPANTQIAEVEVTLDASGTAHFTLSIPDTGVWPVGKYKVDVYLNDKLDRTLEYTIAQ
jgi:hypothetical protein